MVLSWWVCHPPGYAGAGWPTAKLEWLVHNLEGRFWNIFWGKKLPTINILRSALCMLQSPVVQTCRSLLKKILLYFFLKHVVGWRCVGIQMLMCFTSWHFFVEALSKHEISGFAICSGYFQDQPESQLGFCDRSSKQINKSIPSGNPKLAGTSHHEHGYASVIIKTHRWLPLQVYWRVAYTSLIQ